MNNEMLIQLVHADLLSDTLSAAILAGNVPPMSEIVMELLFVSMDAAAVGLSKPEISSRCLLRQGLAHSFLTALMFSDSAGAGSGVAIAAAEMAAAATK